MRHFFCIFAKIIVANKTQPCYTTVDITKQGVIIISANDLSQKIRDLRAEHNLTLEQVAQQVGVGKSTVRKWETGLIENMRRDKIAKLAEALHTTPAYLMGWTDIPTLVLLQEASGCWDGKRLLDERTAQGYSIEQISSLLKISEEDYVRLEAGLVEPAFELMLRLADVFSFSLDYMCHRMMKLTGSTPEKFTLSSNEVKLIKLYRQLDDRNRDAAYKVLEGLYAAQPGEEANSVAKEA